jgi:membrane-associated phospholipid phosphatase
MFDSPRTASYPAGHSLQSYLISYLLHIIMPEIPQSDLPVKDGKPCWEMQHTGLFALARRVADNRVIAGVHFDIDCKAGFLIAAEIGKWFGEWDAIKPKDPGFPDVYANFGRLLETARAEWPQFNPVPA